MILTTYNVTTPDGTFSANWDEDETLPVIYTGDAAAIAFFRAYLETTTVSARGLTLDFESLEPDQIEFCVSRELGIAVTDADEPETDMQPIYDSSSDAETFALIGEGAQLLAGLDENDASFFDNLRRLREIIVALGDAAPEPVIEPTPDPIPTPEPVIDPAPPGAEPEATDMETQVQTVDETPVVDLVQPLPEDGAVVPPADGETPDANPQRTADLTYLANVQAKNIDLWADDTVADRIEAIALQYAEDIDVEAAVRAAIDTYTEFMANALAQAG